MHQEEEDVLLDDPEVVVISSTDSSPVKLLSPNGSLSSLDTSSEGIVVKSKEPRHSMSDYYNDNVNLPAFQRGKVKYTVSDLIPILVKMTPQKACKMAPVGVEHNCSFIIDLDYVKNPKDWRMETSRSEEKLGGS